MTLAPFATFPGQSRGRLHDEGRDEMRGPRDAFQRDRDRIIHSVAFRRLRGKTQVFVAPDGDHYRVRLTHSLEVAQIGRTVARALGLNEDLTEALCLAHDIGHPPFGHAGEDALETAMAEYGGFDHNAQTLRMLTRLEQRYPGFAGLNLSWETLEGLAKHNGPVTAPAWALASIDAEYPLELDQFSGLEAQVAALADDIAYDNHDIDDGLRAGLFDRNKLFEIPYIETIWKQARNRFPDARETQLNSEIIREQIGFMVSDLLDETRKRVAEADVRTVTDIRQAGRQLAGFSTAMAAHEKLLKSFLQSHMYGHPEVIAVANEARKVVASLFASFSENPQNLPESWQQSLPMEQPGRARHIADFIAGMTDSYALRSYHSLFGKDENTPVLSLAS